MSAAQKQRLFLGVMALVAVVYLWGFMAGRRPVTGESRAVVSFAPLQLPCRVAAYVALPAEGGDVPRGCQELKKHVVEEVGGCYYFRASERDFRVVMDHSLQALHTYSSVMYVGPGQTVSDQLKRQFCASDASIHSYHAEEGSWSEEETRDLEEASRLLRMPHDGKRATSPFFDSGAELIQIGSLAWDLHADLEQIFAKRPKALKRIDEYAIQLAASELEKRNKGKHSN